LYPPLDYLNPQRSFANLTNLPKFKIEVYYFWDNIVLTLLDIVL